MTSVQPAHARLGQRFPVPGQPPVFDMLADRVLGRALDLSAGGLKLLVAEPLGDDALYQVRFAIGLERWVARLVEAANVREVTLFPRDLHRLTP